MSTIRLALFACIICLLAACAEQPARPVPPAPVTIAVPPAPQPTIAPLPAPAPPPDNWTRLRARFALDDCNLDPQVKTWARRFTRDPARFEAQMQSALPLLTFVQDAAERADVPGEFVLLPMIESGYDPAEPGRHGDPAGMWQIMPQTARAFGLSVTHGYDGRLDPAASTTAVMKMLTEFHDDLHDWRLVDMAFNAGEYKMIGLLDEREPPSTEQPLHLPVGAITRNHLAKLLAMACIIRDPARFNVDLPEADDNRQLTLVQLPQAADLASAAKLARMPLTRLRELNPGYRGSRVPADAPHHLLLPQTNADDLLAAISANGADILASSHDMQEADTPSQPQAEHRKIARHKVRRGESLLTIASRFHLDARSLRAWNGLASDNLRPGMTLRLSAPD
ncbi:MAG TPA: transglycosylase SLT domain-containing protein [Rhodanobacteraceae bacterium]|nr:transglycosylase SLT domain-containing protein [Rhodanobacteraceae bacterium]